jgi:hypothetical protein
MGDIINDHWDNTPRIPIKRFRHETDLDTTKQDIKYLTVKQFAARLHPAVSPSAVSRWIKADQIRSRNISLSSKANYRIDDREVARVQELFDQETGPKIDSVQ